MRNLRQIQVALRKLPNVAQFCRDHKVPLRTVWRVLESKTARRGTLLLLDAALNKETT